MSALRILIVDDSALVRGAIARLLNNETSWVICGEAATAHEAVEAAIATAPDVVLLDVNLPDARGSEAATLIRENLPRVVFVMISADSARVMQAAGPLAGSAAWLDKSRMAAELVPTIKKLCDRQ